MTGHYYIPNYQKKKVYLKIPDDHSGPSWFRNGIVLQTIWYMFSSNLYVSELTARINLAFEMHLKVMSENKMHIFAF